MDPIGELQLQRMLPWRQGQLCICLTHSCQRPGRVSKVLRIEHTHVPLPCPHQRCKQPAQQFPTAAECRSVCRIGQPLRINLSCHGYLHYVTHQPLERLSVNLQPTLVC